MTAMKDLNLEDLVGQDVGTAVLVKELARGGMSAVFVAYQRTLKRQIAVKILPKTLLSPLMAELFQQEAESAAILSHPNIVPIYEVGETERFLFLSMQLVNGDSLLHDMRRRMKHPVPSRRIAPVPESIKIIMSTLDALGYAHQQGIIHRDMKPANVLIEAHTGRPLISDFGIAKIVRGPEVGPPGILGTPIYMSPEQARGLVVDARTDIYSVGMMLFELVAGTLPLPQCKSLPELMRTKLALKDRFLQKKPSEMNPLADPAMDRIVLTATAFEPEKRYTSCREFMEALEAYRTLHA